LKSQRNEFGINKITTPHHCYQSGLTTRKVNDMNAVNMQSCAHTHGDVA
jgi:hypothetical protein